MPVSITFTTSLSHLFPVALEIAAQADEFTEEPVGKIKRYRAAFGRTPEQAELAVALLQHLDNIKGVLVHAGGRLAVNQDVVIATLGCFIASKAAGGVEQYCQKSIEIASQNRMVSGIDVDALDGVATFKYLHPCTKLLRASVQPDIAGENVSQQILAEAVREGCDWCPNFKATDWRKIK